MTTMEIKKKQQEILLYLGSVDEDNRRAYEALSSITGIEVKVNNGNPLKERFQLPFIKGVDRIRYFGISEIERYISKQHNS